MANLCPYKGAPCKKCEHFMWDEEEERMACFFGHSVIKRPDERELIKKAYIACRALVSSAPPESEHDEEEVQEMYQLAEDFCEAVCLIGFDFD